MSLITHAQIFSFFIFMRDSLGTAEPCDMLEVQA